MIKELSLVPVDKRHYRLIAQSHWGLTKGQMKGMHVHHRVPCSEGGTNDPSNLYVCSPWFHQNVWHAGDGYSPLVGYASLGGRASYEQGKGIHGRSQEEKSEDASKGGNAGGWKESKRKGTGIFGDRSQWMEKYTQAGQNSHSRLVELDPNHQQKAGKKGAAASIERGVGINTPEARRKGGKSAGRLAVNSGQLARARTPESILKGAIAGANTKWVDPDHPELGVHNAGVLARLQRKHGYPSDRKNRKKVG